MIWFLLALAAVSALAPLIGADTRDSRDWRSEDPLLAGPPVQNAR